MDNSAFLRHIFSLLIFGSNGVLASFINLPSYGIVFYRTTLALLLLIPIFLLSKQRLTFMQYKKDVLFIILSGICQAVEWFFMYESFRHIDIGIATLITYLGPVLVIAFSPFVFKEKLTLRKILAITVVLIGVFFLNRGIPSGDNIKFGLLCAGITPFCYAGMVIFNKKSRNIVGFENVILQMTCCCLTVVIFTLITSHGKIPLPDAKISQWALVLCLGFINTGLSCFLYFSTLDKLPAQIIAVAGYLEPLFAIIIGAFVLEQMPSFLQITGCFLIISGACWCILEKDG